MLSRCGCKWNGNTNNESEERKIDKEKRRK
jgi:hypothetical protein